MSPLEARVGMRVKLVRPYHPEHYGEEGTIHSLEYIPAGTITQEEILPIDCDCTVIWDTCPLQLPHPQHTSQLEPILPDILDIPKEILKEADCPLFEFVENTNHV